MRPRIHLRGRCLLSRNAKRAFLDLLGSDRPQNLLPQTALRSAGGTSPQTSRAISSGGEGLVEAVRVHFRVEAQVTVYDTAVEGDGLTEDVCPSRVRSVPTRARLLARGEMPQRLALVVQKAEEVREALLPSE